MKKKITKIIFAITLCLLSITFFPKNVFAASGNIRVYYYEEEGYASREPTYTYTYNQMNPLGITVTSHFGNSSIESHLKTSDILVVHNHGAPGLQKLGVNDGIVGQNGNGTTLKSVNTMTTNFGKDLLIAIYYGCQTGNTSSSYGDLMNWTVSKFAKSSIAWTVDTYIGDVNVWNRYFFEKAKTLTGTGSTAISYADTKLAAINGTTAGSRMKNNRVSRGSLTWNFASFNL